MKNAVKAISLFLVFALFLCALPLTGNAAKAGDVFTPDAAKWGTQDNNGWYYMYKNAGDQYNELPYWNNTASINWQRNNFAFNPNEMNEMLFISQTSFFTGENGSKPVYAFKAPQGGQVELTVLTHGTADMHMEIFRNDESLQKIDFTTTGSEAGFTRTVLNVDVKEGTWLYLVGSTTGAAREGWVKNYSVKYLSVNNEKEDASQNPLYVPDLSKWGTQNNNGWYYMHKGLDGTYAQTAFWNNSATIDWQRNNFASNPDKDFEMYFIGQLRFFVGELGTRPAYGFLCPHGGKVELTVLTHGLPGLYMDVFQNQTKVGTVNFTTTGEFAGFSKTVFTLDVKAGTWLYLVGGGNGTNREGFINHYGVKYLTVTQEQEEKPKEEEIYAPDVTNNWGKQNNNNWYFSYLDKSDNLFRKLAFVRSDNWFEGPAEGGYEYLLIKELEMHPSVKGSPAKVFSCPHGGKIELSIQAWMQNAVMSPTGTGLAVYHNGVKIWPADKDFYKLNSDVYLQSLQIDVAKGDDVAVVIDALEENNSFDATNVRTSVKYLSSNNAVRTEWPEYPKEEAPTVPTTPPAPPTEPSEPGESTEQPSQNPSEPSQNPTEPQTAEPADNGSWWIILVVIVVVAAATACVLLLKKKKVD